MMSSSLSTEVTRPSESRSGRPVARNFTSTLKKGQSWLTYVCSKADESPPSVVNTRSRLFLVSPTLMVSIFSITFATHPRCSGQLSGSASTCAWEETETPIAVAKRPKARRRFMLTSRRNLHRTFGTTDTSQCLESRVFITCRHPGRRGAQVTENPCYDGDTWEA
jgi:hypothetical protein